MSPAASHTPHPSPSFRKTTSPMISKPVARPRRALRAVASALALSAALVAPQAGAVGTRTFEMSSQDDFLGGDLRGVAVDSLGRLHAGWNLGSLTLKDATAVLSAVALPDGSVLLGTAPNGKILRVAGGQASEWASTEQLGVTAMVTDGASVYAATLKGKIWKIEGQGKATEIGGIPDGDHILAMAWDAKKGGLYAATGPNGKLFFVTPKGEPSLVFDSDEPQLSAVAIGADGAVYAGSTGKGLVFKITGPGRATVLLDCPGDEVKSILPTKGGALFVVSNDVGESFEMPRKPGMGGMAMPPMPPGMGGARGRVGRGTVLRIDPDGKNETLLQRNDTHFVSAALDEHEKPYVGTAVEGRVYTVDENHTSTLVADVEARQIGAMILTGKTKFIASSDAAVFHEIRGMGGADAVWTSKALDAGLRATWGRLSWKSDGPVELQLRTGNSATPDATWTDWTAAVNAPSKTTATPGQFVQVRARFSKDGKAQLRNVELAFLTDNARAVITQIDARPRGGLPFGGPPFGGSKPGGATLPKPPGISAPPMPLPTTGSDTPARASGVSLSWRSDNPDGDQLRYRLKFRFDGHSTWRDLTKPDDVYTRADFDWDTTSLPEGYYRVQVEATDELANPPDRVTSHTFESAPILVDNTPPVFRKLEVRGKRLVGEVVDGIGPISRIDFALNGRTEWRPLLPKDGVFDEAAEEFDVDLAPVLGQAGALVAVRVFDRAGNQVVRDIEVK